MEAQSQKGMTMLNYQIISKRTFEGKNGKTYHAYDGIVMLGGKIICTAGVLGQDDFPVGSTINAEAQRAERGITINLTTPVK